MLAVFSACSDATPLIDQTKIMRLISFDSKTGKTSQSLSVFSAYNFKDGLKNLQSMYILHDNLQLLWHLQGQNLQNLDHANRHWIGNAHLALVPGEPVPIGKFRIVLSDRSGHKALSEASLPQPGTDPLQRIPRAQRQSYQLSLSPPQQPGNMTREIIIMDWSGAETNRFIAQKDIVDLSEVLAKRKATEFTVWLLDTWPEEGIVLRSGPW